jgi:hypothetical protein
MPSKETDFRTALQVSPEVISNLTDTGLTALMRALLHDHAYRCGAPVSEVRVNTEEKAADDGCDAWSPAPAQPDQWFGDSATCWQLKAGVAGQPAKLAGEISKTIPFETLKNGGRVVLIASGSTNGPAGERDRLKTLQDEAKPAGLSTNRVDVIGSERLTIWCNQHPAVAARFSGAPEGLWLLDQWSALPVHHAPWQPTTEREAELAKMRAELDFSAKGLLHLHIQGRPGVGKSRFALELCKGAAWNGSVIYIRDASDLPVQKIIHGAVAQPGVRLVLVVDEIQFPQLLPLRDALDAGEGRVRLITIGHCETPDPAQIPALALPPLDEQTMRGVVSGWHSAMPREHVAFVVRFADGYVRLARLASDAVARNPSIDVRGILDQGNQMLARTPRSSLTVEDLRALVREHFDNLGKHEKEELRDLVRDPGMREATLRYLLGAEVATALLGSVQGVPTTTRSLFGQEFFGAGDGVIPQSRIERFGEALFNLQAVPGFQEWLASFPRVPETELAQTLTGRFAEIDAAGHMFRAGVLRGLRRRRGLKGDDYDCDLLVDGERVAAEIKAKIETTALSVRTCRTTIERACDQLPPTRPGIVWIELPQSWVQSPVGQLNLDVAMIDIRASLKNLVAVITHFVEFDGLVAYLRCNVIPCSPDARHSSLAKSIEHALLTLLPLIGGFPFLHSSTTCSDHDPRLRACLSARSEWTRHRKARRLDRVPRGAQRLATTPLFDGSCRD